MPSGFLPSRQANLLVWSENFRDKIVLSPTTYGLTTGQATGYSDLHDAAEAAYQTANSPDTRSPSNVLACRVALDNLVADARRLARIVQADPDVTEEQKSALGLTVRDAEPSLIGPPAFAPAVLVVSVDQRTVRVRLKDSENPTRRGKAPGTAGAAVFSYVGDEAPASFADFRFEGNTSRTTLDVSFPSTVPAGAKVWIAAYWFSPRLQAGPWSAPTPANLPGGTSGLAA